MENIKIAVQGNRIALLNNINLIAGTVGQKCQIFFDSSWNDLNKTIVYKVADTVLASEQILNSEIIIPATVLATAGLPLEIGITGQSNDNTLLIPTTWYPLGYILPSAYGHKIENNAEIIYDGGVII